MGIKSQRVKYSGHSPSKFPLKSFYAPFPLTTQRNIGWNIISVFKVGCSFIMPRKWLKFWTIFATYFSASEWVCHFWWSNLDLWLCWAWKRCPLKRSEMCKWFEMWCTSILPMAQWQWQRGVMIIKTARYCRTQIPWLPLSQWLHDEDYLQAPLMYNLTLCESRKMSINQK